MITFDRRRAAGVIGWSRQNEEHIWEAQGPMGGTEDSLAVSKQAGDKMREAASWEELRRHKEKTCRLVCMKTSGSDCKEDWGNKPEAVYCKLEGSGQGGMKGG